MSNAKPQYAILRIEKLKTKGSVASQASHVERTRPTKNADPERTHLNRWLVGGPGMYAASEAVWSTIPKIRSDAVLALDVVITASPEAFDRETGKLNVDKWAADSVAWIKEHFAGAEIVGLQLQLDESTPHIQGIIIPTEKKPGGDLQLNAKKWLGGKAKLRSMQTNYAKAVAHHGLERGIEGSEAKHEKISSFYGAITSKTKPRFTGIKIEPPPIMMTQASRSAWAERQTKTIIDRMRGPVSQLQDIARSGIMHQRQNDHLKRSNSRLNGQLEDLRRREKEAAAQLRSLPLEQVAKVLGCHQSKKLLQKDVKMWESPAGKIRIEGSQFFNHETGEGGGGAFDLVMHINDCTYNEALAWLRDEFDPAAAVSAAVEAARIKALDQVEKAPQAPFKPPEHVEGNWARVRSYLTDVRALASSLVDKLREGGWIGADFRKNAFFLKTDGKKPVSVELRGTGQSSFKGSRGRSSEGVFVVQGGTDKLAICESAIDAISYVQLHPQCTAIATGGTGKWQAAIPFVEKHGDQFNTIVCASDNGPGGRGMASAMNLAHEPPPNQIEDWNAAVQALRDDPRALDDHFAIHDDLVVDDEPKNQRQKQPRDDNPSLG